MNHISLEKGKPGCVQIYPLCRTHFGQYQVALGMLACDTSCVWGACMLLSFYCHVVYVASHELYWAALNFSPSSQAYHEIFVMDNFRVLVSRFPPVCITTWHTHRTIVSCEIKKKLYFVWWAFSGFHKMSSPTYTVMTTLSLSIIVGVCSWLPLCLGHWISLWWLHSASHTVSWLGRYAHCWSCVKFTQCTSDKGTQSN